jgi:hypothetical protein
VLQEGADRRVFLFVERHEFAQGIAPRGFRGQHQREEIRALRDTVPEKKPRLRGAGVVCGHAPYGFVRPS